MVNIKILVTDVLDSDPGSAIYQPCNFGLVLNLSVPQCLEYNNYYVSFSYYLIHLLKDFHWIIIDFQCTNLPLNRGRFHSNSKEGFSNSGNLGSLTDLVCG